jgi:hypothetical protein
VLATTIRAFGVHKLREYESGLTHPLMVHGWRAGDEVEFTYRLGEKPGFQVEQTKGSIEGSHGGVSGGKTRARP